MTTTSVRIFAILIAAASAAAAGVACQAAVNLDVKYTDAGVPDVEAGEPDPNTPKVAPGEPAGQELEGCPCDETQGLACCASGVGPAFCTTDQDRCNTEKGGFYRCFGPDYNTESVCCFHGAGAGVTTAYAAGCDGGATACTSDKHCTSPQKCTRKSCPTGGGGVVTIGACGQEPPACPP